MFNDDQIAYMRSLAAMPDEARCWCGWYRVGECQSCPKDVTRAHRRKEQCPSCGNFPHVPGGTLVHIRHCPVGLTEQAAQGSADLVRLRGAWDRLQEDSAEGL